MGTAEHARQRLRVIASTEVPKDISALRDVESVRQCSDGWAAWAAERWKVSYGWVAGTAGTSVQQTAVSNKTSRSGQDVVWVHGALGLGWHWTTHGMVGL
jgi:hypothetical protein